MPEMSNPPPELQDITVFERGWMSSNNVLLHGQGQGAVLIDTGHVLHAAQTVALVGAALAHEPLLGIVNTHLHSDHCGGNASVQRAFSNAERTCIITIPPGQWRAVETWDEVALSYAPTGQQCERFVADNMLMPGDKLRVGQQSWRALAAPGHDPHSLIIFNDAQGVVITADALWQRGLGVIFPELDGAHAFEEAERVLDVIESLKARTAIPGHGAPFTDIAEALKVARQRLAGFRADPQRHMQHAMKALIKFHMLEVQQQTWAQFTTWLGGVSLYPAVWQRMGRPEGTLNAYAEKVVSELATSNVLAVRDGVVFNA
jgi:glyoxylase-like metal-dependent hydrolase (beta-lactamase superfamily II)